MTEQNQTVHVSEAQKDWTTGPDPTFCGGPDYFVNGEGIRIILPPTRARYKAVCERHASAGRKVCETCNAEALRRLPE